MPEAAFIVHLDDFQGFLVKKKHPSSLTISEKTLNLVFFEHEKGKKEEIQVTEIEDMKIASFTMDAFPGWTVSFVLGPEEVEEEIMPDISGMGRFLLELMNEDPETVDLGEVLEKKSMMPNPSQEQKCASIFMTPSSALLLERLNSQGVESTAKLSMWLKSQVQSDDIDLREAISPLMNSGLVHVELVGKTAETAFLIKDVFGYRAPPVESFQAAKSTAPSLAEQYFEFISGFFSPAPPAKGYNPTLPVDDPNSPIMEDRQKISEILANSLYYTVLESLRQKPQSVTEISSKTSFPEGVVQRILWNLEAERIVAHFEQADTWALVTNPIMEIFMPEYILPIIAQRVGEKSISPDIAGRYLELLIQTWSE